MPVQSNYDKHYSISEASTELRITPQLLRLWESQGHFSPKRNSRGHRYYTHKDLEILKGFQQKINSKAYVAKVTEDRINEKKEIKTKVNAERLQDKIFKTKLYSTIALAIVVLGLATFLGTYLSLTKKNGNIKGTNRLGERIATETKKAVLGQRDREAAYQFIVNVPTNLAKGLTVDGDALFNGDISTPSVNLTGLGSLAGLTAIDTTTETTLESTLDLTGDVEGTLDNTTIAIGSIDGTKLTDNLEYDGTIDVTGTLEIDGNELSPDYVDLLSGIDADADDINTLEGVTTTAGGVIYTDGSTMKNTDAGTTGQVLLSNGAAAPTWGDVSDADTLDTLDSLQFLRSDTSDSYTSGTLSFSDDTFLDLSAITHDDTAIQGIRLPQNDMLSAPASGEGYIAYDTDADKVYIYNGTSWTDVSGASTPLQEAYEGGGIVQMSAGEGDIRFYNDGGDEILFLDESNGRVGIGNTAPSFKLDVTGTLQATGVRVNSETVTDFSGTGITVTGGALTSTLGTSIVTSEIVNDTILEIDFDATNSPTDGLILSYDNATGGFTWIPNDGGSGASKWTDGGTTTYLTSVTDDLAVGGDTLASSIFAIDESEATFYVGYDNSSSPEFLFESADGDQGTFGFNNDDTFYISGANFQVGAGPGSYALDVAGDFNADSFYLADSQVTSTATEINVLDGITSSTTELNLLTGRTGTLLDTNNIASNATTGVTAGAGLTGGGTVGVLTVNVAGGSGITANANDIELGVMTEDWDQTGAYDIVLNNADSQIQILESAGDTYYATIDAGDLAGNTTYTLSGATGTIVTDSNAATELSSWDQNSADDLTTGTSFSGDVSGAYNNLQIGTGAVGTTELANDSILEIDLDSTNSPTDDYVLSYDQASGGFTWVAGGGGGTIDGSGTGTYITMWQDSDTITDSSIFENSGKIGIGTTAPDYDLDIAGDIGVDYRIYHNDNSDTYFQFTYDEITARVGLEQLLEIKEDGTQDFVKLGDGGDVDINLAGGTEGALFVQGSSGYVGIGTTNPGAKLEVNGGQFKVVNSNGNVAWTLGESSNDWELTNLQGLVLSAKSNPTQRAYFPTATATTKGVVIRGAAAQTANLLEWQNSSGTGLGTITAAGYLGIGTTNPSDTLHVAGNIFTTTGLHVGADSTDNLIDDATNGSGSTTLFIGNESILASGDIGSSVQGYDANTSLIGQTIETGEIADDEILEVDLDVTNSPTDNYILSYDNATGGFTWVPEAGGTVDGSGTGTYLTMWQDSDTLTDSSMFENSGSIGIGTTAPSALLSVNSSGANVSINNPTDGQGLILQGYGGGTNGQLRIISNGSAWADNTTTAYFQIKTGANNNATFMGGTYGADAPLDRLQFNSEYTTITNDSYTDTPVATALFEVVNDTAARDILQVIGAGSQSGDYLQITSNGGSAGDILTVDSTGSVGIGTTGPSDTLHVAGNIFTTTGLHVGADSTDNLIDDATNGSGSTTLYIGNESILASGDIGSSVQGYDANTSFIGQTIETGEITDDEILEVDLDLTNSPTDNYMLTYDNASGGFTWVDPSTAGPIDGSGTTNYLPLWGDSDTLTNSSIYETGGNIGIGITLPSDTLHVAGNILATAGLHVGVDGDGTLIDDASTGSSSTTLYIGNESILASGDIGSSVQSYDANTTLLGQTIETGEITDDEILEVDLDVTNSPTDGYVLTYDDGTGGFDWTAPGTVGTNYWTDGGDTTYLTSQTDDLAIGGTGSGSPLFFDEGNELLTLTNTTAGNSFVVNDVASDTTPFVIDEDGGVGIGTTNPAVKLDVVGAINSSTTVTASTSVSTPLLALTGTGTINGLDAVDSTTENTIEGLIFDADAENITGAWEVQDNIAFAFGDEADFKFLYDETSDDRFELTDAGDNLFLDITDQGTTAEFAFNVDDFFIDDNGNVGIGTTAPNELLHASGLTSKNIAIESTAGGQTVGFEGRANAYRTRLYTHHSSADRMGIEHSLNSGSSYTTILKLGLSNLLTLGENQDVAIDSNGNVGIGTTNPGYDLQVEGSIQGDDYYSGDGTQGATSTTGGLTFKDGLYTSGSATIYDHLQNLAEVYAQDGSTGNAVELTASNGDIRFYNDGGTEMLFLDESSGNVGIGTTVPTGRLSLSNNDTTDGNSWGIEQVNTYNFTAGGNRYLYGLQNYNYPYVDEDGNSVFVYGLFDTSTINAVADITGATSVTGTIFNNSTSAISQIIAFSGNIDHQPSSAATATNVKGVDLELSAEESGTISNLKGVDVSMGATGSGVVTEGRGFEATCFSLETCIGLYLDISGNNVNEYGIWGAAGDWVLDNDGDGLAGGTGPGGDLIIGEGQDLEIYHGGTNSYIMNNTGDLYIGDAGTDDVILSNNGGKVGIGTDSPQKKMDIVGAVGQQIRLSTNRTDATQKNGYYGTGHYTNAEEDVFVIGGISTSGSNPVYVGGGSSTMNTATSINFFTAANNTTTTGTERMRIESGGDIGIGTTNPTYLLEVNGTLQADDYYSGDGTQGATSTTGGLTFKDGLYTSGSATTYDHLQNLAEVYAQDGSTGNAIQLTAGNGDIRFYNDGSTEMLFLDESSGEIGIGTTDPTGKLHVAGGNIRTDANLIAGDLYLGYDDTSATITTNDTNEDLTIDPNGTGEIILTGNVGIGTTNPSQLLEVVGNMSVTNSSDLTDTVKFSTDTNGNLAIDPSGGVAYLYDGSNAFGLALYDGATSEVFITTNGYSYFYGGNVGIGDSTPDALLDLEATTEQLRLSHATDPANDYTSFTTDTSGNLIIAPTSGAVYADYVGDGTSTLYIRSDENDAWGIPGDIAFQGHDSTAANTTYNRIRSYSKTVTNGSEEGQLYFYNIDEGVEQKVATFAGGTSATALNLYSELTTGGPSGVYLYGNDSGSNDVLYAYVASNVVDNTDTEEDGRLSLGVMNAGSSRVSAYLDTDSLDFQQATSITTSAGDLTFTPTDDSIFSSGNVGIGTTAPVALFQVHNPGTGSGDHSYAFFTTGDTGSTDSDGLQIGVGANNQVYIAMNENRPFNLSTGNSYMTFSTNSTEAVRIDSSGYMGIGTTNPGQELEITGDIKLSDGATRYFYGATDADTNLNAWNENRITFGANYTNFYNKPPRLNSVNFITNENWISGDGGDEGLFIDSDGDVGIGTTAPLSKLEVYGTSDAIITAGSDGSNQILSGAVDFLEQRGTGFGTTNAFGFRTTYDGDANLYKIQSGNQTSINTRLAIERDTGYVGIGTTNPGYLLEVDGTLQADDFYSGDGTQGATSTTGGLTFKDGLYTSGSATTYDHLQNLAEVYAQDGSTGNAVQLTASNGDIRFYNDGGDEMLFLDESSGYLGIGMTAPDSRLTLAGSSAAGNAISIKPSSDDVATKTYTYDNPTWTEDDESFASTSTKDFYLGYSATFSGIYLDLSTVATLTGHGPTALWEYYNGATWEDLEMQDGTSTFTQDGLLTFNPPSDWATTTLSPDDTARYWVRISYYEGYTDFSVKPILNTLPTSVEIIKGNAFEVYATNTQSSPNFAIGRNGNLAIGGTSPSQSAGIYINTDASGGGGYGSYGDTATTGILHNLDINGGKYKSVTGTITDIDVALDPELYVKAFDTYITSTSDNANFDAIAVRNSVSIEDGYAIGVQSNISGADAAQSTELWGTDVHLETTNLDIGYGVMVRDATSTGGTAYGVYVDLDDADVTNYAIYTLGGHNIFNDNGEDYDFRIEGDTDTGLFFADASADSIGIGTTNPSELLHLSKANGSGDVGLIIQNNATTNGETASLLLRTTTADADYGRVQLERVDGSNTKLHLASFQSGSLNNSFTLDQSGYVGIGTTGPSAALDVGGGSGTLADGADDVLIAGDLEVDDDFRLDGGTATFSVATNFDLASSATALTFETDLLVLDTSNDGVDITTAATTTDALDLTFDSLTTGTGIDMSLDALTEGTGLSLASTSTALTSGSLMTLDWSPGSATTATGDLFSINIGANGSVDNLFAIYDNTSDIFTVSETQITSAVPHSFTAAGDVSMAYDLIMSNQTSSKIESYGPFTLEVGESFENNDLTITTYGTGAMVVNAAGGSEFTRSGNTVATFDRTSSDGTIISLQQAGTEEGTISVSTTTVSYNAFTGSHYAWAEESVLNTLGIIDSPAIIVDGEEIIEETQTNFTPEESKGLLVSLTGDNKHLHNRPESEMLYGIDVTTLENDSKVMGAFLAPQEGNKPVSIENPLLVMAVGNADIWVADTGEDIESGDYLTSSNTPGHARIDNPNNEVSYIIARAAEDVDWTSVDTYVGGTDVKHKKISVFFESFVIDRSLMLASNNTIESDVALIKDLLGLSDTFESSESETDSSTLSGLSGLVSEITDIYTEFKEFTEALGLSQITDEDGNDILAVESDMTVTGNTSLADVTITGDVMAGLIKIDTINNSIGVVGPECDDDNDLCQTQTLYLQKTLAGNIDLLDGTVVITPKGTLEVEGIVKAKEFAVNIEDTLAATAGKVVIEAGETTIEVKSSALTDTSLILATPREPVKFGTKKIGEDTFEINLGETLNVDVEFDWFIVKLEAN